MFNFGIVVFPGSNCDHDCYHVARHVLGHNAEFIWHQNTDLASYDCVIIPGGFSYGDYLRTGSIASLSPIMNSVKEFAAAGGPVIGICNGFQVLVESGLLPGALIKNSGLKFICKWIHLKVENNQTVFTNNLDMGEVLRIPVAHGEGNYFTDKKGLGDLLDGSQIVFRYCDEDGNCSDESNPNGSIYNIAGICNREGNVLGMMPHPERCSEVLMGGRNGLLIFESVLSWLEGARKEKSLA